MTKSVKAHEKIYSSVRLREAKERVKNKLDICVNQLKVELATHILFLFSWLSYHAATLIHKCCHLVIHHVPENIIPEFPCDVQVRNKKLVIDNFQFDTHDVTKKIKMLFWMYWDSERRSEGKLLMPQYLKFIGDCSMIFIDYHLQTQKDSEKKEMKYSDSDSDDSDSNSNSEMHVKMVIEVNDNNKLRYITPSKKIDIPFGEIQF